MKSLLTQLVVVVVLATVSSVQAAVPPPAQPAVVVKVDGGGFHWIDAAAGSAATLAVGLLVLGLVLTLRTERRRA